MFMTLIVPKHQVAVRFRYGDFYDVLRPGKHYVRGPLFGDRRDLIVMVDRMQATFEHERLEELALEPALEDVLSFERLADDEIGIVERDGCVVSVIGPGLHALPMGPRPASLVRYSVNDVRLDHPNPTAVLRALGAVNHLAEMAIPAQHDLVVYRDGALFERVERGRFVYMKRAGALVGKLVDLREQVLDVSGQELMTKDQVTLRLNLTVVYRVTDSVRAVEACTDIDKALYREAQLALRETVGTRTLEALLSEKEAVRGDVLYTLADKAVELGAEVGSVGIKDVILPGDMKAVLNQVIEARKRAEANLIKRREETAAARSQANTARLLADNPVLARLKELEILQETLAGARVSFVLGQGDLLGQLRTLANSEG